MSDARSKSLMSGESMVAETRQLQPHWNPFAGRALVSPFQVRFTQPYTRVQLSPGTTKGGAAFFAVIYVSCV